MVLNPSRSGWFIRVYGGIYAYRFNNLFSSFTGFVRTSFCRDLSVLSVGVALFCAVLKPARTKNSNLYK